MDSVRVPLLPQPGGFEGLGSGRIFLHPPDLSLLEPDEAIKPLLHPRIGIAAVQAAGSDSLHRHHPISCDIARAVARATERPADRSSAASGAPTRLFTETQADGSVTQTVWAWSL